MHKNTTEIIQISNNREGRWRGAEEIPQTHVFVFQPTPFGKCKVQTVYSFKNRVIKGNSDTEQLFRGMLTFKDKWSQAQAFGFPLGHAA